MVRITNGQGIVMEVGLHELRYAEDTLQTHTERDTDDLDTLDNHEQLLEAEEIDGFEEAFIRGWLQDAESAHMGT